MSFEELSAFFASSDNKEATSSNPQNASADGDDFNRDKRDPFSSFGRDENRPRDGEEREGDYSRGGTRYYQRGRRYGEQRPYSNDESYPRRNDYSKQRRFPDSSDGDAYPRKYSKPREYSRYDRKPYNPRFNGQSNYDRPREQYRRSWYEQRPVDEGKPYNNYRSGADRRPYDSSKDGSRLRRREREDRGQYRRQDGEFRSQPRRPSLNKRFAKRFETFSLAEVSLKKNVRPRRVEIQVAPDATTRLDALKREEYLKLSSLELVKLARRTEDRSERRLILQSLREKIQKAASTRAEGVLEFLPEGFGFLRCSANDFVTTADDVYVSPNQIRSLKLRPGSIVCGLTRPPKSQEKIFALLRVLSVDGFDIAAAKARPHFSDLVVRRATKRLRLTRDDSTDALDPLRAIEKNAPICLGQRATLVAPAGAETQSFFYKLVSAALSDNPEIAVVLLLHSADPKEVKERFNDPRCEIVSSVASSEAWWKVHVANLAFERAKRLVESGRDVVVFCDSFDLLASAWKEENAASETGNRASDESPQEASPKTLLCLARNIEDGGSLTVVAATQPENGDAPADFKGVADAAIFFNPETGSVDLEKSFSLAKAEPIDAPETTNPAPQEF